MDPLTDEIARELTVEMLPDGAWKALAEKIGPYNVIVVLSMIYGGDIYVPKPDRLLIPARNARIVREYTGYNLRELAKKYGLTERRVKHIIKTDKEENKT